MMDKNQLNKKVEQLHTEAVSKSFSSTIVPGKLVIFGMSWGFAVANFLIGVGFLTFHGSTALFVAKSHTLVVAWGVIFLLFGCFMLGGLFAKNVRLLRLTMLGAFCAKMMWLIALMIRISFGGSLLIVVLWALVTYLQWWLYLYFTLESRYEPGE